MSDPAKPADYYAPDGEVNPAHLYHRILRIEEENKRLVAVVAALRRQEQSSLLRRWREEAKIREDISLQRQQLELKLRRLEMALMNLEAKPELYVDQFRKMIENLQQVSATRSELLQIDGVRMVPAHKGFASNRFARLPSTAPPTLTPVSDRLSTADIPLLQRGFKTKDYVAARRGIYTRRGRGGSDLTFIYGPYVTLSKGRYRALIDIETGIGWPGSTLDVDASVGNGQLHIARKEFRVGLLPRSEQLEFEFVLSDEINPSTEVRISAPASMPVAIRDIRLFRLEEITQDRPQVFDWTDVQVSQDTTSELMGAFGSPEARGLKERLAQLEHDVDQKLQAAIGDTQRVMRERWETIGSVFDLGLVELQQEATAQIWAAETRHYDFMMELQRRLETLDGVQPPPAVATSTDELPTAGNIVNATLSRGTAHVGFFLRTLSPGGLEGVVADLALGFTDVGHRVTIIVEVPSKEMENRLDVGTINVLSLADERVSLRDILEREQIDVLSIHHAYQGLAELEGWSGAVVETLHNYYAWQRDNNQLRMLRARLIPQFIAVSNAVAEYAIRTLEIPRASISIVPNAHPFRNFVHPDSSRLKSIRSRAAKFHFIHVANFYPVKAHSALLRAFRQLLNAVPTAHLDLVGRGLEPLQETVRQYGLDGHVTIHGQLSQRDLSAVYAKAHCFLLPSIIEGWSMSVMEAMYFELPLILTDIGSARDLIVESDIGLIVPAYFDVQVLADFEDSWIAEQAAKYDVTPLVRAMTDVSKNYEQRWAAAGRRGREKLAQYDLGSMIDKYDAAFRSVAAANVG